MTPAEFGSWTLRLNDGRPRKLRGTPRAAVPCHERGEQGPLLPQGVNPPLPRFGPSLARLARMSASRTGHQHPWCPRSAPRSRPRAATSEPPPPRPSDSPYRRGDAVRRDVAPAPCVGRPPRPLRPARAALCRLALAGRSPAARARDVSRGDASRRPRRPWVGGGAGGCSAALLEMGKRRRAAPLRGPAEPLHVS